MFVEKRNESGVLLEAWDDVAKVKIDYTTEPDTITPYSPAEATAADLRNQKLIQEANKRTLENASDLQARITRLLSYTTDPDVVAALARPNATAPTTAELNRIIKLMLRRQERITAALVLLMKRVDSSLLTNLDGTADV